MPWAVADPVTCVDRVRTLRAQIGTPGLVAGAGRRRQVLAMPVRPRESAQVGAITKTAAGDEEGHLRSPAPTAVSDTTSDVIAAATTAITTAKPGRPSCSAAYAASSSSRLLRSN